MPEKVPHEMLIEFATARGFTQEQLIAAGKGGGHRKFTLDDKITRVRKPTSGEIRDLRFSRSALLFTWNGSKKLFLTVDSCQTRGHKHDVLRIGDRAVVNAASLSGGSSTRSSEPPAIRPEPRMFMYPRQTADRGITRPRRA